MAAAKQAVVDGGDEGLIIKRLDAPYTISPREKKKRSDAWTKWKAWLHRAYPIEHHGPTENGGYTAFVAVRDGEQEVAVQSHRDRERLRRGEGAAILVRYLEETDDGRLRQGTCRGIFESLDGAQKAETWRR